MTPTAPLPMLRRPDKQVSLRLHSAEWREIQLLARQHDLKVGQVAAPRASVRPGPDPGAPGRVGRPPLARPLRP